MFKIDKGLKCPKYRRNCKYPFPQMDVGDSIFDPECSTDSSLARVAAAVWGKRNGVRFTSRAEDGGVRIWRVE